MELFASSFEGRSKKSGSFYLFGENFESNESVSVEIGQTAKS